MDPVATGDGGPALEFGDLRIDPAFIATQYGEGYLWVATPSQMAPVDAFLTIGANADLDGHAFGAQPSLLIDRLREAISAGLGPERRIADMGRGFGNAHDRT